MGDMPLPYIDLPIKGVYNADIYIGDGSLEPTNFSVKYTTKVDISNIRWDYPQPEHYHDHLKHLSKFKFHARFTEPTLTEVNQHTELLKNIIDPKSPLWSRK